MRAQLSITPAADNELAKLENIYLDSFPEAERRPWSKIVSPDSEKGPKLFSVSFHDGPSDSVVGMLSLWNFGTFVYIEHFAIDASLRGFNLGARVLASLREHHPAILLEVEKPSDDNPMAERRINFYTRNGFHVIDHPYIQPPYAPGLPELPMILMCTSESIDAEKAEAVLHREVYGK